MTLPSDEKLTETHDSKSAGEEHVVWETLDLTEGPDRATPKPHWRENPRLCLADSATDALDALLLEHMGMFEKEVHNIFLAADIFKDLLERSRYLNHASVLMDHVVMIHDHRNKYRNYGRQEITLIDETRQPSPPKPERPVQEVEASDGMFDLTGDDWRKAPQAFLRTVAKNPSESLLLGYIAELDNELRRCLAKGKDRFDPAGRAPYVKLALSYAKKVLRIAESLRKPHVQGRQRIIVKHEPAPTSRARHVAGRHLRRRAATRTKQPIAV